MRSKRCEEASPSDGGFLGEFPALGLPMGSPLAPLAWLAYESARRFSWREPSAPAPKDPRAASSAHPILRLERQTVRNAPRYAESCVGQSARVGRGPAEFTSAGRGGACRPYETRLERRSVKPIGVLGSSSVVRGACPSRVLSCPHRPRAHRARDGAAIAARAEHDFGLGLILPHRPEPQAEPRIEQDLECWRSARCLRKARRLS